MHLRRISTGILAIAAIAGCASTPPAVESAPQPATNDRAATIAAAGTPTRWQGTFQPIQQRTGMAAPTSQNKTSGSIFLAQAGPSRTRIRLVVSTPIANATSLQWALVPGRCGSGSMPLTGVERFPVIEISNNGRGELDMEISLTLPTSGSLHADVYVGAGTQLNNVIACANLSKQG
ncbi:MAG: hypothetical protein NUW01_10050 [Gemmatimonadaceae bacterium]|nr:hypothetical protein [Gemmatimonadaceae bacterium]